jgi:malonate transporter
LPKKPKSVFKAKAQEALVALAGAARALVLNPIILSVVVGMAVALFGPELPRAIDTFASLLADSAGPTALFALGLGLTVHGSSTNEVLSGSSAFGRARVTIPVALKLVLQPLVAFGLAVCVFELEPLWATVAVIMSALPVGATAYVFAERYGAMEQETSRAILVSTVLSVLSISFLLLVAPGGAQ